MERSLRRIRRIDPDALEQHSDEAARLLKALANAQRLKVLCLLLTGELNVGQINQQLPELSQSALSQHLGRLRYEGLVVTRRESQTIWYTLPPGPAGAIIKTLYEIYCSDGDKRQNGRTKSKQRGKSGSATPLPP